MFLVFINLYLLFIIITLNEEVQKFDKKLQTTSLSVNFTYFDVNGLKFFFVFLINQYTDIVCTECTILFNIIFNE